MVETTDCNEDISNGGPIKEEVGKHQLNDLVAIGLSTLAMEALSNARLVIPPSIKIKYKIFLDTLWQF